MSAPQIRGRCGPPGDCQIWLLFRDSRAGRSPISGPPPYSLLRPLDALFLVLPLPVVIPHKLPHQIPRLYRCQPPPRPYSDDTKMFFTPTLSAAELVLCLHLT